MAGPNIFINAAVAQVLGEAADRLEAATDKEAESHKIISDFYQNHKRIIFNGNGYSEEWAKEAKKRGLPHYRDTVSALPQMASEKSLALLEGQEVLSRGETLSRLEIYLEGYSKQINVEASTMIEMCRKEIIPAMITYLGTLSEAIWKQEALNLDVTKQKDLLTLLNESLVKTMEGADLLHQAVTAAKQIQENPLAQAKAYRDTVVTRMEELRTHVDLMEIHTDKHIWPIPSYDDLLFRL